jgi:hypothetical protein
MKRGRKLHQTRERMAWVKRGSPRTIVAFDRAMKAGEYTTRFTADVVGGRVWMKHIQYWTYEEPQNPVLMSKQSSADGVDIEMDYLRYAVGFIRPSPTH